MARSFTTVDLVQLPALDAGSAQALATAVLSAAEAVEHLPDPVTEALHELKQALYVLQKITSQRLRASMNDPQRARRADVKLDACWSGTFDWLTGWAKMPDLAEAEIASSLLSQIFPDDSLKFIQVAWEVEWAESRDRLQLIKDEHLDAPIEGLLGGKKILAALRAAHHAYGDALGITAAPTEEEKASLREALFELTASLRQYVVQVSATVRRKNVKTAELAAKLLAPITAWEKPGGKATASGPPEGTEALKGTEAPAGAGAPEGNLLAPEKPSGG
jgi:hypothetical protein